MKERERERTYQSQQIKKSRTDLMAGHIRTNTNTHTHTHPHQTHTHKPTHVYKLTFTHTWTHTHTQTHETKTIRLMLAPKVTKSYQDARVNPTGA